MSRTDAASLARDLGSLRDLLATLALELERSPQLELRRREDGWQVREILSHAADIAEVFCERLVPGTCPGATETAVRRADGHIDLDETNEHLRRLHGSRPASHSLGRLFRCIDVAGHADPEGRTHGARRIHDHTSEHLGEISGLLRSSTGLRH